MIEGDYRTGTRARMAFGVNPANVQFYARKSEGTLTNSARLTPVNAASKSTSGVPPMPIPSLRYLPILLLTAIASAQNAVPELDPLRVPYSKNLALIRTTKEQRILPITTAYVAALERLEKQVAADPFALSAVKAERERVAAKREPLEMDRKEMPPALAELRARYDQDVERSNAPLDRQEQQMTRQYITALDALQRRLTSQNQVAKAAAVRAERIAAAASLPKELAPKDDEKE